MIVFCLSPCCSSCAFLQHKLLRHSSGTYLTTVSTTISHQMTAIPVMTNRHKRSRIIALPARQAVRQVPVVWKECQGTAIVSLSRMPSASYCPTHRRKVRTTIRRPTRIQKLCQIKARQRAHSVCNMAQADQAQSHLLSGLQVPVAGSQVRPIVPSQTMQACQDQRWTRTVRR